MKIEQILKLLTESVEGDFADGDLFQKIDETCPTLPCMDLSLDMIDRGEEDYYGADLSGTQKLCQLFFLGSSDYFPGLWVGEDDLDRMDEMPVYIFDLSGERENQPIEPEGNLKHYLDALLDEFLSGYTETDEYKRQALFTKANIQLLSDNMIDKGNYVLKSADS